VGNTIQQQQLGRGPHLEHELMDCHTVGKGQYPNPIPISLATVPQKDHKSWLLHSRFPHSPWLEGSEILSYLWQSSPLLQLKQDVDVVCGLGKGKKEIADLGASGSGL
jgi:hypothetical protein